MKLKYDCPPSFKHNEDTPALWKSATTAFLEVIRVGLEALESFGDEERFVGVWRALVDVLEGSLLSPSSPPSSMTIEELDFDEHFDMSVLISIQNDIIIHMGRTRVPRELVRKLVNVIQSGSRLYLIDDQDDHRINGVAGGNERGDQSKDAVRGSTGTIMPVMRETFAYAALRCLFALCSGDKEDHPGDRKRIAQIAAPVLLERCEFVLRNYTADQPLLGRCPFPRYLMGVRNEEILFILKQLINLRLREDILETADIETSKYPVKRQLLAGQCAHLFFLYSALCDAVTCGDATVVGLIGDCLRIAGREMGVLTADNAQ
ncbi:hypothetical protein BC938DRAFT_470517 [Jimgerdemannia flammicorona]|uniref:Mon2 C-terminal domain-containing protein n=1 Tax=Jimgerdemannia flammicorona TaxID=994334 RepID=A0A433Q9Z9_9FUNG|nr:hypothetical protein BC938DRAFT_470517 [Jimgerdemannia flammicorona]